MALALLGAGMMSPVGFLAPTSCAAIRCGINCFEETRFKFGGEWVVGSAIPIPGEPRGAGRLLTMTRSVLEECFAQLPPDAIAETLCVLCLPEPDRPGRPPGLERKFEAELAAAVPAVTGLLQPPFLRAGRLECIRALQWLDEILAQGHARFGIVLGVDSLLSAGTLRALQAGGRPLHTVENAGLIPGEAAAAVIVSRPTQTVGELQCLGFGWGHEPATPGNGLPLRAEGLATAIRDALKSAGLAEDGCGFRHIDYRIADVSGEELPMKETALVLPRVMRVRKAELALWCPSESLGEVGVAAPCVVLAKALAAVRRRYAPGPGVLTHFGDDAGRRAAVVLRQFGLPSSPVMENPQP